MPSKAYSRLLRRLPIWPIAALLATLNMLVVWFIDYALGLQVPIVGATARGAATFATALLLLGAGRAAGMTTPTVAIAVLIVAGDVVAYRTDPGGPVVTDGPLLLLATFILMRLARLVRADRLTEAWPLLTGVGLALCAITLLPGLGVERRGQRLVSAFGGNTAELGRVLVLAAVGAAIALSAERSVARWRAWAPLGLTAALVVLQLVGGDNAPLAVIAAGTGIAYALRFGRVRLLVVAAMAALVAGGVLFALTEHLDGRLSAVREPVDLEDPSGPTQVGGAMLAAAWAELWGVGPGRGLVRNAYAPAELENDFALIVLVQEHGIAALIVVMVAWATALAWGWGRVARSETPAQMVAAGTIWGALSAQVLLVSAGVLSLLPHAGMTLPWISGGRSSALTVSATFALLVALTSEGKPLTTTGLPAAVPPARAWWPLAGRLRILAIVGTVLIATAALFRIDAIAERVNDSPNNPWRITDGLRRGVVSAGDAGQVVQLTTGWGSLDTVQRHHLGTGGPGDRALRAIIGPTFGTADVPGLSGTLAGVLRCGGRGELTVDPERTVAQAAAGDQRDCHPAGVSLSLDPALTDAADGALQDRPGAVVIGEVGSGRVLAIVGRNPRKAGTASPDIAMLSNLPPGSTFKALVGLTVPGNAIAPTTSAYRAADGTVTAGGRCGGTLAEALAVSCNAAFARWAEQAGTQRLRRVARAAGIGAPSLIAGLPRVSGSLFSAPPSPGMVAAAGYGQGQVTVSVMHAMTMAAGIAGSGMAPSPTIVDAVCSADGQTIRAAQAGHQRRMASAAAARRVAEAMRHSRAVALPHLLAPIVGAKTGTAEIGRRDDIGIGANGGNVAWTVAFTEVGSRGRPALALAAMVLPTQAHPRPRGGVDAARVVARLSDALAAHQRSVPGRPCRAELDAALLVPRDRGSPGD